MDTTNSTMTSTIPIPPNLQTTLGAAFFGFCAGAILFGITVRQAYQYYTTNSDETWARKGIIALVCFLDTLHLVFSMYMVYSLILELLGHVPAGKEVVWSLKGLASTQTFLIVLVQGFYLLQIWRFSRNPLLVQKFTLVVQVLVIFIAFFALGVAVIFLSQLQKIEVILGFSDGFEYIIYLGFGATALIDCAIAAAMCLILHKSRAGAPRSESVLESLIQYFVGTGLLTSFAAIMVIILYVAQPHSLLYLGVEFSVTRLYANSILAMFNSRKQLRGRLNETIELKLPSNLFFSEPDTMSQKSALMGSNPFSPDSATNYSPGETVGYECECMIKGHKDMSGVSVRSYTV